MFSMAGVGFGAEAETDGLACAVLWNRCSRTPAREGPAKIRQIINNAAATLRSSAMRML